MIIKTDKAGKELESWPTLEEAAKAIKVSPAVLKKHLKGRPPKLGGFKFKENSEEKPLVFSKPANEIIRKTDHEILNTDIHFQSTTPESFDSPPLDKFLADEVGLFGLGLITKQDIPPAPAIMIDEFGDVIPPIPESAFGCPPIPPDLSENEITENDLLEMHTKAQLYQGDFVHVDPEQVADYLRTPLERRLHEIKRKK